MKLSSRMRVRLFGGALGLMLAAIVGGISSSSTARAQAVDAETACTPDVMSLCNEAIPDRGKIVACLRAKRKQVSMTCRQAMASQGAKKSTKRRRAAR